MSSKAKDIVTAIFSRSLTKLLSSIADAIAALAKAIKAIADAKKEKAEAKQDKEREKEIDQVTQHGTLEDLLDMKEPRKKA